MFKGVLGTYARYVASVHTMYREDAPRDCTEKAARHNLSAREVGTYRVPRVCAENGCRNHAGRCGVSLPQNWNPLTARLAGKGVIQSLGRMGVFRRFGYVIPISRKGSAL